MNGRVKDLIKRDFLLQDIVAGIDGLARISLSSLMAPRVISVDGEWGAGKTWLAAEVSNSLEKNGNNVITIDLFRFDHHDDPFAVIASAIFEKLRPSAKKRKKFLDAAGAVMKVAAPVAVKAATKKITTALAIEDTDIQEIVSATAENADEMSAKAVEKLFKKYAETQQVQENFTQKFSDLTRELERPLVILLDELDRCRPSFALETLERVKHLFSAENVVFVFFWNAKSIHESVKHTYGAGINAERYLSKFVALEIAVNSDPENRSVYRYKDFVTATMAAYCAKELLRSDFSSVILEAAFVLQPSLREIQKAIYFWSQNPKLSEYHSTFIAYFILLKSIAPSRLEALSRKDSSAALKELKKFKEAAYSEITPIHAFVGYLADSEKYDELIKRVKLGQVQPPTDSLDAQIVELGKFQGLNMAFGHLSLVMKNS